MQDNKEKKPVMFANVFGEITQRLKVDLEKRERQDVASQLDRLMVVSQMIQGSPENITFAAHPIPLLSSEQRLAMELRDWEKIDISLGGGHITLVLNEFGQIDSLYIKNLPEMYTALKALKGYIGTEENLPQHIREKLAAERASKNF